MFIGRLEKDKEWNYGISLERNWNVYNRFARILTVWFLCFEKLPEVDSIDASEYRGFYWNWHFNTPVSFKINRFKK